jgi:hypothetical protein
LGPARVGATGAFTNRRAPNSRKHEARCAGVRA